MNGSVLVFLKCMDGFVLAFLKCKDGFVWTYLNGTYGSASHTVQLLSQQVTELLREKLKAGKKKLPRAGQNQQTCNLTNGSRPPQKGPGRSANSNSLQNPSPCLH